jgi:hypothetical protein
MNNYLLKKRRKGTNKIHINHIKITVRTKKMITFANSL